MPQKRFHDTPLLAYAAATSPESRRWIGCSAAASSRTDHSCGADGRSSSSRSTAQSRAAYASARRWEPVPPPGPGYDLALTERVDGDGRRYLVDVGTEDGAEVLAAIPHCSAEADEISCARADVEAASHRMGRQMPSGNLRDLLVTSRESPQWEEVASRCLTCGNCTMVCPTCFCTSTEDVTDLTGEHAERWQNWASCFEPDFSYIHGGNVRQSGASRYRQWLTHKLGTWHDQFGMSGCVGCGRCIAWCPTGIDITEEMNKMASADGDDD